MPIAFLGLGTNIGDRRANLERAVRGISRIGRIFGRSRTYETAPVGYTEQAPFWNAVVRISTAVSPHELLFRVKEIEREMGRQPTFRNGPRLIDIDVLLYDDAVIATPTIGIPHPRLLERAFVLLPLLELAPHAVHPVTHERIDAALPSVASQAASPVSDE